MAIITRFGVVQTLERQGFRALAEFIVGLNQISGPMHKVRVCIELPRANGPVRFEIIDLALREQLEVRIGEQRTVVRSLEYLAMALAAIPSKVRLEIESTAPTLTIQTFCA